MVRRKFSKTTLTRNIKDPYRCLGLAVIQLAFADGDREWLILGDTLDFWCAVADIDRDALKIAYDSWFAKEVV